MVLDDRVTRYVQHVAVLVVTEALGTQCHTLIQRHVVADDGCLTNHHTRAVVNGEVFANLGTRVDINTRPRVSLLRDDTGNDGHLHQVQHVRYAVVRHRVHHRVTVNHLAIVGGSGVALEHRLHIRIEQALHLGQLVNKLQSQVFCRTENLLLGTVTVLTKLHAACYLALQQVVELVHAHANMVRTHLLVALTLVEIVGEDDVLTQTHNTSYLFYTRHRSCTRGHHVTLALR